MIRHQLRSSDARPWETLGGSARHADELALLGLTAGQGFLRLGRPAVDPLVARPRTVALPRDAVAARPHDGTPRVIRTTAPRRTP